MRKETILTQAYFQKGESSWEPVVLPHTWNNLDGQDGGADYWRGEGRYRIPLPAFTPGKRQFVQFEGANHIAEVSCNGREVGRHEGGFSTFRFELTPFLHEGENDLLVRVNNGESHVYPQQADFTFFGGLYRNVTFLEVEKAHFELMKHGTDGLFITPDPSGKVRIDAFTTNADGCHVTIKILDASGMEVAHCKSEAQEHTVLEATVPTPHLWHGLEDPYLYTMEAELSKAGTVLDCVTIPFGFRSFSVDPDKGFFLNGASYPLHGVSRHQDRLNKGWAISKEDHEEDLSLIKEVGANTIRLAHYQHAQYFYQLCDKAGMILWAEIPFISVFLESREARDNTLSQMTELVAQNYNHPSICFWGISNEITIGGENEQLLANLKDVNALCKKLDPSRLTTMAQVTMLPMESEHNQITDVLSYNHYFGWYMGEVSENGPWLDEFHKLYPNRPLGVSEYGSEAVLQWHSSQPEVRDYSEEYQAYYHEEMLKTFATRPYLWSTHVWNMFDFAADARDEGGCKGRNNKGLVTYDRKTKKDAFYVYQAFWAKSPFVHVCGRRFVDRAPGQRDIKVYSNCSPVTLLVNGKEFKTLQGDKIFVFSDVPLTEGDNTITATAPGTQEDTILLRGVDKANQDYILPQEDDGAEGVANWFEGIQANAKLEFPEGYFSIKDKIKDIMANSQAAELFQGLMEQAMGQGMGKSMKNMMGMVGGFSLQQVLKMAGKKVPAGADIYLNQLLNKIPKN